MSIRASTLERTKNSPDQLGWPTGASPPPFRGLDGLRAIAVIAVMAFHLTPGKMPSGFIGVDIFFVVSGFLITSLLLRERSITGRIRLVDFWRRRARRLLPALALVIFICGGLAWALGGDILVGLRGQLLSAASFSSNWFFIGSSDRYFDSTAPDLLRHLWSLAIEEQFYLVWPLVVLGLGTVHVISTGWRRQLGLLAIGSLAAASAIWMAVLYSSGAGASRVYYGTDTHSFPLLIGALLAFATAAWPRQALGWSRPARFFTPMLAVPGLTGLALAFAALDGGQALPYVGGLVAVAICTALVITGAVVPGSWIGWMLDRRLLRWIGQRSYGLYLWHWPLFVLVQAALPTWPRSGWDAWAMGAMALVLTVTAAALSYRFVEVAMRRHGMRATIRFWFDGTRSGWRRAVVGAVVLSLLTASIAGTLLALAAEPQESSARASIERGVDAIAREKTAPEAGGDSRTLPGGSPADEFGSQAPTPPASGPDISAIGDSVMLAAAPALQEALPGIQIDAVVSRQLREAPALLGAMADAGTLRSVVVIGLGTNGPIDTATLIEARRIIGPDRRIVVVDVQAPREWTAAANQTLTSFADRFRNVQLATWNASIAGQLELLAGDQIHPGPRGGKIYASALTAALQRLAELPPEQVRSRRQFD